MFIRFTPEQFQWVIEGERFQEKTISLLYDHYVKGISKKEAVAHRGETVNSATQKWRRFEALLTEKCTKENLEFSLVFHKKGDRTAIAEMDKSSRK